MSACRTRTRRTALLAHGLTSVRSELKKATEDERMAKIGMPGHTRKDQDMKARKVRLEICRKLTKYRGAKIGQIEQFWPDTINLDCVTPLCHSHIIG